MTRLSNIVTSFALGFTLIVLLVAGWEGFRDGYAIEEQNTEDGKTIFEKLSTLSLLNGINTLVLGFQALLTSANGFDLLGALAVSASGSLQIVGGIVLFPAQLFGVIFGFYENILPPVVEVLFGILVTVTVGFIIISAKLGYDL